MPPEKDNAYTLKRQGKFQQALMAYAHRYAEAQEEDNEYIAQVCLDQMLDIQLLQLLKEGETFDNRAELKHRLQIHIADALREVGASDRKQQFDTSWRKFSGRGVRRSSFSVDWEKLSPRTKELRGRALGEAP